MSIRERAKQGQIVEINNRKYFFRCETSLASQFFNSDKIGIKLEVTVYELDDKEEIINVLTHKQIKGTYISEKLTDFIKNAINGQQSFYWDWNNNPLKKEVTDHA